MIDMLSGALLQVQTGGKHLFHIDRDSSPGPVPSPERDWDLSDQGQDFVHPGSNPGVNSDINFRDNPHNQ